MHVQSGCHVTTGLACQKQFKRIIIIIIITAREEDAWTIAT